MKKILAELRSPALVGIALYLGLWSFEPLSTTIVYLHMTEQLGLGEQVFGNALSALGLGCILGSIAYGFLCRRYAPLTLAHAGIVIGVLIQLDLAARIVSPAVAATIFACLMALTNFSSSLAAGLGGVLYEWLLDTTSPGAAFSWMIIISAVIRAGCWVVLIGPMKR
ncbi:MAG: hypothetical protein LC637_11405 [Xanthomonadaceae bacterium]|nr:hypothetical protein [Xanthomonadaceae bacterium]